MSYITWGSAAAAVVSGFGSYLADEASRDHNRTEAERNELRALSNLLAGGAVLAGATAIGTAVIGYETSDEMPEKHNAYGQRFDAINISTNTPKNGEEVFQNINRIISIKDAKEKFGTYFTHVRDFIIPKLNENASFKALRNEEHYAGSYTDHTIVKQPNKFVYHLYFYISEFNLIQIIEDESAAGLLKINVENVLSRIIKLKHYNELSKTLKSFTDQQGFLIPEKIRAWMQGLITEILNANGNTFKKSSLKYSIKYRQNESSHSLDVLVNTGDKFSIDFTPVIKFKSTEHWVADRPPMQTADGFNTWVGIPKPFDVKQAYNALDNTNFQACYQRMEKVYIKDKNNFKTIIRLFKKLRDHHQITNLKTYHIKTVCLWINYQENNLIWNKSLWNDHLFLDVFEKLLEYFHDQNLPFFWNKSQNLLEGYSSWQTNDIYFKLRKIYMKLRLCNPGEILPLFLDEDEICGISS